MFIYQRHIILNILTPFLGVVFTITGIVWLSQIIKLIYLIDRGIGFQDFVYLILLVVPSLLFAILPFAMALSALLGVNKLSHERELIVLSNSGLSPFDLIKPVLLISIFVSFLGYALSLYLLPLSYGKLKTKLRYFRENYATSMVQEKVFTEISKNVTLYIDEKKSNGLLKGVILFDNRAEEHKVILFAKSGRMNFKSATPEFELYRGMRQEVDAFGKMSKMHFDTLSVTLQEQGYADKLIVDQAKRDLQEYFIYELFYPDYEVSQDRRVKLKSEGHMRLVWPLYNLALTALALSVFMQKPYSRRGNAPILIKAVSVLVLILGLHFIISHITSKNEILNAMHYLNIMACFVASYLLLKRVSKRAISVPA